jgi:sugar lactone lactonase YvrE
MSDGFSKPQVLECPACGATLALPDGDTFVCDYCGKTILVPPELRRSVHTPQASTPPASVDTANIAWYEALDSKYEPPATSTRPKQLILVISVSVALLLVGVVVFILTLVPINHSSSSSPPAVNRIEQTALPTELPFARQTLVFGSQGEQPGQFDDARSIAVDPQGNIFVADYTSGRINKFDSQGRFHQLIKVPSSNDNPDVYIFSIATDAFGNLFVTADGSIYKYSTSTGELLATIPDQWPQIYFEKVTIGPDGNLYATNGMAGSDEVIILSPQGEILAHWTDVIENVNHDDAAIELAIAVSHAGTTYLLSPFGNRVYGYNPDGTFKFSFGEEGDKPGQFSLSTGMLVITDQDYLVVSDVYRVDLFDAGGNYLGKSFTIDYQVAGGSLYGMTIDSHGDLYYISSGGKVLKFSMTYP